MPGGSSTRIIAAVRIPRILVGFAAVIAVVAGAASAARADGPPVPMGFPDLLGARGLALGAYRGTVTGNDGIFTNAASLAAQKRYAIEGQWLLDREDGQDALHAYTLSVVDSSSTALTGGLAFTHVIDGAFTGNAFHLPLALQVSSNLYLGVTGKYFALDGQGDRLGEAVKAANVDAAAWVRASRFVSLGAAGYNLVSAGHKQVMPRALGLGLAVGDVGRYQLCFDWRADFDRQASTTHLFAVGGEYLVGDSVPIRGSYVKDDTRNASFWSAGLGYVSSGGFGVDASYRQRIEKPEEWTIAVGVKLFLFQ